MLLLERLRGEARGAEVSFRSRLEGVNSQIPGPLLRSVGGCDPGQLQEVA